jgi:hypothetical protein
MSDNYNGPAMAQQILRLQAERDALTDVLYRSGFRRCNTPACNCNSWHQVKGWPERFDEIEQATNDDYVNGETLLKRVNRIYAERDALRAEVAHWKANHASEVQRARILKERPDIPIERVRAYEQWAKNQADAERYRYLRNHCYKPKWPNNEFDPAMHLSYTVSGIWSDNLDPAVLDGCIDAAREVKP